MTIEPKLTPAQKQYMDLKNQYADCILFFRMGDFYETFYEDAKTCAKLLDLTITTRDRNSENPVPMAGVPYHAAEKYIAKLVAFGLKIAIAEQMTEPKAGQIVERAVTHVVTPATFIEESKKEFLYIAAVAYAGDGFAQGSEPLRAPGTQAMPYQCARGDVTVGSYWTRSFATLDALLAHLMRVQPRELVIDIDFPEAQAVREHIAAAASPASTCLISTYDQPADVVGALRTQLRVQTLASFGKALEGGRAHAMALLTNYLARVQPHAIDTLVRVQFDASTHDVMLDLVTIKNLEILQSQYDSARQHSLLGVIDTTACALGARLLREILTHPTQDMSLLLSRQAQISTYLQRSADAKRIHEVLRHMLDIPKIVATILYKKATPTVFGKLRYALELVYGEMANAQRPESSGQVAPYEQEDTVNDQQSTTHPDAPVYAALRDAGVALPALDAARALYLHVCDLLKTEGLNDDIDYIRDGYSAQIDELRQIAYHSDALLLAYQQELVAATGIANIKIKYVSNQGYVLEVTPKDVDACEAASIKGDPKREMIRRQTLKTGQRYTTVYLDELQHKVLGAQFELRRCEEALVAAARTRVVGEVAALQQLAEGIAWVDVCTSHALFALERKWVMPVLVESGPREGIAGAADAHHAEKPAGLLEIVGGRHPVIEAFLPHDQQFIPNDVQLGGVLDDAGEHGHGSILHLITGPNMGGKSTYLRQTALIVLLAQCGLCVPAQSVRLTVIDGLFARVGSGDVLAKNQSTFMTEMIEMSNILHNATRQSLVILDELGRGTSTYDGMALAQAIVQYIVQHIGAKTLFATHYHELIALEHSLPGVQNFSVSVYETDHDVVFMKKIIRGGADKSYGLDVAKLAGIPSVIVDTARKYLSVHESGNKTTPHSHVPAPQQPFTLFDMHIDRDAITAKTELDRIRRVLDSIDPNNMTPMQALAMIGKLKGEV